jgi:parallel beta-helix repeat protein
MKRLALWAVVLAVLLSGTAAWADFYVIAGGGAPGTRITSVPYTISTPGFYYLGSDLTYSGGGNAITVNADDVTLDLMGFSLTKDGPKGTTRGIYLNGRTNVEIRNGTIRGFYYGVFEQSNSGKQHRALDVRATATGIGIEFNGSDHLVKACNASNNSGSGIHLDSGVISDCVASNNSIGLRMQFSGNVQGNTAFNNSTYNFSFGTGVATAILVDRNSAFGLTTNYYVQPGTTGVQWGTNAGTP